MEDITLLGKGVHGKVTVKGFFATKEMDDIFRAISEIFVLKRLKSEYILRAESYELSADQLSVKMSLGVPLPSIINKLDGARKVQIINGLILGLADLQNFGFVHGDIKPDNIILDCDGSPKLIDFGIVTGDLQIFGVATQTYSFGGRDYIARAMYALGITICKIFCPDSCRQDDYAFARQRIMELFPCMRHTITKTLIDDRKPQKFLDLLTVSRNLQKPKVETLCSSIDLIGPYIYEYGAMNKISSSIIFDAVTRMSHLHALLKIPDDQLLSYALGCVIISASLKGDSLCGIYDKIDYGVLRTIIDLTYAFQINEIVTTTQLLLYCHDNRYHHHEWKDHCAKFIDENNVNEDDPDINMVTLINMIAMKIGRSLRSGIFVNTEKRVDYFLRLDGVSIFNK